MKRLGSRSDASLGADAMVGSMDCHSAENCVPWELLQTNCFVHGSVFAFLHIELSWFL